MLQNASVDCEKFKRLLFDTEPADPHSDYFRMFKNEGMMPAVVKTKHWENDHGDFKHYVLDPMSCVLYREAFFE